MDKFYDQFGGIGIVNGIAYIETLTLKDLPKLVKRLSLKKMANDYVCGHDAQTAKCTKVVDEMADKGIIVPKDKKKN